jgi:hypothetical protein
MHTVHQSIVVNDRFPMVSYNVAESRDIHVWQELYTMSRGHFGLARAPPIEAGSSEQEWQRLEVRRTNSLSLLRDFVPANSTFWI